ncbi:MFS transporter [Streptomyces sp. NPDC047002]|uniref:MFS transporter n=1 Tax=Streptomyces sp. NPDC047002 TaxID=3155475 RepID=UPI0034562B48
MTLSESLDNQELTRFRRKVTALSSAGMFLDGFDLTVIAVALPLLEKQWHISGWVVGLTSSSALIGMFVGAVVLGRLTDKIGRRKVYAFDLILFIVFAGLAALSQNPAELIAFRFLLGIAVGADYPISTSLTSEFSATHSRGRHLAYMSSFYSAGAMVAYLMGIVFGGLGDSSWRWMLLFGALLALIVALMRQSVPESPRWLTSQGRTGEAAEVLGGLVGSAPRIEAADEGGADPSAAGGAKPSARASLLSRQYLRATVFVCAFFFLFDVVFYGIQLYTPTVLSGITGSSDKLASVGSACVSAVGMLGIFAGSLLIDRWGRRPLVILGLACQAVLLTILALVASPPFAVVVLIFAAGLFSANIGPGVMILLYPGELFPTPLRGAGVGVSVAAGRIGAVLGVLVFPHMIESLGLQHSLWMFVAVGVAAVVLSVFMAPETKGKLLEEIADEYAQEAPAPGRAADPARAGRGTAGP